MCHPVCCPGWSVISTAVIWAGAPVGYRIGSPVTVLPVDRTIPTSGERWAGSGVDAIVSATAGFSDRDSPSSRQAAPHRDDCRRHFGSVQDFDIEAPCGRYQATTYPAPS